MGGILDKLDEWLRGLLVDGIKGNLTGMFDSVNTEVGEIAGQVGQTPQAWNGGVFSMIQNLSETVIVPIAGVILTFVMCYELTEESFGTKQYGGFVSHSQLSRQYWCCSYGRAWAWESDESI